MSQYYNMYYTTKIGNNRCNIFYYIFHYRLANTKFVLIPSQRDVHHDCVYPQPPFSSKNIKNTLNSIIVSSISLQFGKDTFLSLS